VKNMSPFIVSKVEGQTPEKEERLMPASGFLKAQQETGRFSQVVSR
jgi:hypothetical protein